MNYYISNSGETVAFNARISPRYCSFDGAPNTSNKQKILTVPIVTMFTVTEKDFFTSQR